MPGQPGGPPEADLLFLFFMIFAREACTKNNKKYLTLLFERL
jgi:hypothetical protein